MRESLTNAVMISLLVAAVVVAHGLYQTPRYEATAVVLVVQKAEQDECHHGICPIPNAISDLQDVSATVAKVAPTMPVARAVVERLNLPRGSAEEVLGNVSVEQEPGTMFIDITYEDSESKRAQLVANAIGQVLSQKIGEVNLDANRITATLWKPATLPTEPVSPKPLRNGLITLVSSLGLSIPAMLIVRKLHQGQ
jgi:capsular polysaccharide biosynthesis protein